MLNEKLTIVTWNVNRDNVLNNDMLNYLFDMSFDLIFLQEVNNSNLEKIKLKFSNYDFILSREVLYSFEQSREYYLVTLVNKRKINKPLCSASHSMRTVVSPLYKLFRRKIYIEYSKIVVSLNGKDVTVINCHLQYAASPSIREKQLLDILSNIDTEYFILSGDLNTFSSFPLSFFIGSLFGYPIQDYLKNEVSTILSDTKYFAGKSINTSIYYTGKLDWILCSKQFFIQNEYTLPRLGSDHYPLVLICEV